MAPGRKAAMCARHGDVASPFSLATRNLRRNSRKTPHTRALALLAAQIFSFYFPPCTLHRAPAGQGPSGPGWLATALGFWSGRPLATGMAWAALCLYFFLIVIVFSLFLLSFRVRWRRGVVRGAKKRRPAVLAAVFLLLLSKCAFLGSLVFSCRVACWASHGHRRRC